MLVLVILGDMSSNVETPRTRTDGRKCGECFLYKLARKTLKLRSKFLRRPARGGWRTRQTFGELFADANAARRILIRPVGNPSFIHEQEKPAYFGEILSAKTRNLVDHFINPMTYS